MLIVYLLSSLVDARRHDVDNADQREAADGWPPARPPLLQLVHAVLKNLKLITKVVNVTTGNGLSHL
ncbi:MAG: hypothetical protein ACYCQJ_12520 [Nitrososphaerales archaeon]